MANVQNSFSRAKRCWKLLQLAKSQNSKTHSVRQLCIFSKKLSDKSDSNNSLPGIDAPVYIQGFQSREHEFAKLKVRNLDRTGEESVVCSSNNEHMDETIEDDPNSECYQPLSNVSLYSVMQTNVPDPYAHSNPGHLNMPGGGIKLGDKFTSNGLQDTHPANPNKTNIKYFSTYSKALFAREKANVDAKQEQSAYSYGIKGEDMQGVQGPFPWLQNHTVESLSKQENPCPQGIQGAECEKFKLWLANCTKYNFINCEEQLQDLKDGRKNLGQIFEEQEKMIEEVVNEYQNKGSGKQVGNKINNFNHKPNDESTDVRISQKDRLKKAVSQYGTTVIVFHIGISLMSLGGFYVAVSSGLDVISILEKIGGGLVESRLATGASTFVVAYAVHKVFAPVRIGITLTCTPFIVKHLRKIGVLKKLKKV